MSRTLPLTTGFLFALIAVAVIAPGATIHDKKHAVDHSATVLVASGHTLFLTNCSPCHGANAQGDDGPNLHHKNLSDTFVAAAITSGFKNEMPPFASKLKPSEVKALVLYIHSLNK